MIEFRPIELSDREWIEPIFHKAGLMGCEYTFCNNFIWSGQFKLEIAYVDGFYCTRSGQEAMEYGFPIGEGDLKAMIELLIEDAKERNEDFIMHGLLKQHVTMLESIMPGKFEYSTTQDDSDYIYTVDKLSKLSGKKLHGKRNHIARFMDNEDWSYEKINEGNMEECMEMNKKWCEMNHCHDNTTLKQESCAVKRSFRYYKEFNLVGGLLRLHGEVVAFTLGEPLNESTFVVHVEKAYSNVQGAYPMMNQQFVLHECQNYEYVNREEDMGEEGLRKAKMSYYPDILLEKFRAVYKNS